MARDHAGCRDRYRNRHIILTVVLLVGTAGWAAGQALGPEIPIWVDTVNSLIPAVAFNIVHEEFLVVWYNEQGPNTWDIYARRVGLDGTLSTWFSVATGASQKHSQPVVAYNPLRDEYLVVWVTEAGAGDEDLWGSIVTWNGSSVGARFWINLDVDRQTLPKVTFNPNAGEYLVVYTNYWAGGTGDVAAQRVAGDGTLLSWANVATSPGTIRHTPSVAFHPGLDQYLIAYTYLDPTGGYYRVHSKVAAPNLAGVSVASEVVIFDDGMDDAFDPAVAAGGDGYIVQFSLFNLPLARRVAADGTPLGPETGFQLGQPTGNMYFFPARANAVAPSEAVGYVSAWHDLSSSDGGDVGAGVVSPYADRLLSKQLVVADGTEDQQQVAIACAPWGTCLVAHQSNGNIVGHLITLGIFGDGFETGDPGFWSAVSP